MPELTPEKRVWCWVQRPIHYEVSGCACGNADCDWSEFKGMLWCPICRKDFVSECSGIFGGPVGVETCKMIGIDLREYNIETGEIRNV